MTVQDSSSCPHCGKPVTTKPETFYYYCWHCNGLFHGKCFRVPCSKCQDTDYTAFTVGSQNNPGRSKRRMVISTTKQCFEISDERGPEPTTSDSLPNVSVKQLKLGNLIGAIILFCFGTFLLYWGALVLFRLPTQRFDLLVFSIMVAMLGFGGGSIYLGWQLMRTILKKKENTPEMVTRSFYEKALNSELISTLPLVQRLHPDTIAGLIKPIGDTLRDAWYGVRNEYRMIAGASTNAGIRVRKVESRITENPSCRELYIEADIDHIDEESSDDMARVTLRRTVFQFHNRVLHVNGEWMIERALPGKTKGLLKC